jgi:hypothetical protein
VTHRVTDPAYLPERLSNPRWLCSGCGETWPLEGPAFPRCLECGARCRFVTADNLPYVDRLVRKPALTEEEA